jgi:G:T-mismatch repair DNA endonuclease (very short patch repair protein)
MEISEKINCELCGISFTKRSLGIHISAKHPEIKLHEYYQKYIDTSQDGICKFCGIGKANFLGVSKGFSHSCKDQECYNKSIRPASKEYKMKIKGMTESEYYEWRDLESDKIRKTTIGSFSKARDENPNFDKENSRYCKEFWMKKGHGENESSALAHQETEKNRNKLKDIKKDDPDYQKGKSWNSYKYWMGKGMSEDDAKKHVSEKQGTFSLKKCIEKHGEEIGKKIWTERQEKWARTLDSKTDEEKLEILRKKVFYNKVFSNISQDLFEKICNIDISIKEESRYATNNDGEMRLELGDKIFLKPDFVYNKKIIEFYGDYWHCNPNLYDPGKIVRRGNKKYRASSIWKIDAWREKILKDSGYEVMIVWENEYNRDPEEIVNKCYNYLKDVDNKG